MGTTEATYAAFDSATRQLGACAIVNEAGEYVARAVFRYPSARSTRVTCFLQVWGEAMQRGHADGGGYDKETAAFEAAAAKLTAESSPNEAATAILKDAAGRDDGKRWADRLVGTGLTVLNVTG